MKKSLIEVVKANKGKIAVAVLGIVGIGLTAMSLNKEDETEVQVEGFDSEEADSSEDSTEE